METKPKKRLPSRRINYLSYENPNVLKGWKYAGFISALVGFIGIALYPIVIYPMLNVEEYKKIQEETRKDVDQESIQPGNMRVWSNPFAPRNDRKPL